jgi:hypothetical protein
LEVPPRGFRVACFEGDRPEAVRDEEQSEHIAAFAGGVGRFQIERLGRSGLPAPRVTSGKNG